MDKLDYAILDVLHTKHCTSGIKGMPLKDLLIMMVGAQSTIYSRISKMIQLEFICHGVKESRAFTFYITKKGIDELKGALQSEE